MSVDVTPQDLFVSLNGKDSWSGHLPEPNAAGTDGPLASFAVVKKRVRMLLASGTLKQPITVWIRGGRYSLLHPLSFGPEDSGPVTYAAFPGEEVVFDAGRVLCGFSEESLHGRRVWKADVSEVLDSTGFFRQLFVNGVRRPRARLPKAGQYYWMRSVPPNPYEKGLFAGSDLFFCNPGDVRAFRNLSDVEIVAMHFWTEERMPMASVDEVSGKVKCRRRSIFELVDDIGDRPAKYYVDHVFEGLTDPGEWYLDRSSASLYYLPMEGETLASTEVVASAGLQFLRVIGKPEEGRFVEGLTFRGLTFRHADWVQPDGPGTRYDPHVPVALRRRHDGLIWKPAGCKVELAAVPQAACNVPGALFLEGARNCALEECTVERIGFYAIEFSDGCLNNRVERCTLRDLGAGGVKISGSGPDGDRRLRTGNTVVCDCQIHEGGRIFLSAIGVLIQHAFGNWVAHNHIHDFLYTAISCGWIWGYSDSVARENRIEKNHIHDLGGGVISDMGGVYLLGIQPGTRVAGNVIHDIQAANYGGWGIYPDEGSSHIVIENNIVWNTSSQPFHQHFGRENTLRNNIWAFGREGQMAVSRGNAHGELYGHPGANTTCAFTFLRNIVVTDRQPAFVGALADATGNLENGDFIADLNLYWDVSGGPVVSGNGVHGKNGIESLTQAFDWSAWQALGYDLHSLVADPRFANLASFDFTLGADSPALALGFQPIDTSDVGPRPLGTKLPVIKRDATTTVRGEAYMRAPKVLAPPGAGYGAATRKFQGIPSLAFGLDGRLWVTWYGGVTPGEDHNNYVVLVNSRDGGRTWSDELLVADPDGDGPVRAFDPELWLAPDGRVWLFWAQGVGHAHPDMRNGVWAISGDANETELRWSEPRRLCDGVMMCKPLVLSTGEWMLPVSFWHRPEAASATVQASADRGRTWTERGACDVPPSVRSYDEHMVMERQDRSLWMLVRTAYGIGESLSRDGGRTWSRLQPTNLPHPCSRFFIRRLTSGRVLMVRHVPAAGEAADGKAWGKRANLTAFLSDDEGRTWPHRLPLDEREGISYPDGDQAADGTIHVVYDYRRTEEREILMASFREEDILRGHAESPTVRLRVLVNKATG